MTAIANAVDVPVNADFEGGFAVDPDGVAANVTRAAETGIAGLSIEDSTGDAGDPLFEFDLAVERIRAARAALDADDTGVLLTGRSEGFIVGRPDLAETTRRLVAYAEAGADCLYAPGLRAMSAITAVVQAVAPKPVNVLVGSDFTTVAELADAGVRRISVGGALARSAWGGFIRAATEIAEQGTFRGLADGATSAAIEAGLANKK
jgi:methylisocitrate lyase